MCTCVAKRSDLGAARCLHGACAPPRSNSRSRCLVCVLCVLCGVWCVWAAAAVAVSQNTTGANIPVKSGSNVFVA